VSEGEVVHNIASEFIESNKEFWGPEFAALANVKHRKGDRM